MTAARSAIERLRTEQAGATLTELLVGMVMLSVVATGVLSVSRSLLGEYSRTSAITTGTSVTGKVFLRLEKQVRYARGINQQTTVVATGSTDAYVELLMETPITDTCVQWRLVGSTDTLQTRQWPDGGTAPSTWTAVASNVVNDLANPEQLPFVFSPSGGGSPFQKLDLHLYVRAGKVSNTVERKTTFIARNSDRSAASSTVCRDTTGEVPR